MGKKWEIADIKKWGWEKHPLGAVIPECGTTEGYETGGWRSLRPILNADKCIDCFICFIYCPDSSVVVSNEKMHGFKLEHCKGCGICANVCPRDAISMIGEAEAQGLESCRLREEKEKLEKSA